MFNPYSIRKGKVNFEEQVDFMNRETKIALASALEELKVNYISQPVIEKSLYKYYPKSLKNSEVGDYRGKLVSLESADDINTFLEVVLYGYNKLEGWDYIDSLSRTIKEINEVFRYRKYMYTINLNDLLIYPYSDIHTNNEISEILSNDDLIAEKVSTSLRSYTENPGSAIHDISKALELFMKNELLCKGKTLGTLIKSYKKSKHYELLSASHRNQIDSILDIIVRLRNSGKDSGHSGDVDIKISEARLTIMSGINLINTIRMDI